MMMLQMKRFLTERMRGETHQTYEQQVSEANTVEVNHASNSYNEADISYPCV